MSIRRPAAATPPSRPHSAWAVAAFGLAVVLASATGARFNPAKGRTARWYRRLRKPAFTPPNWVFPVVWTPLYAAIATSGYLVWRSDHPDRQRALRLWALQLALNAAWPPLFFGLRRPGVAMAELTLLGGAVAAYTRLSHRADPRAALLVAPYLGWVGFAGALNGEIVRKNR